MGPKQRKAAAVKNQDDKSNENVDVGEQLDKALAALGRNRIAMLTLYVQWRSQLLRLSYAVMMVIFHQLQGPTTTCIKQIKEWNRKEDTGDGITGLQAIVTVLSDSIVEILSLSCVLLLVFTLRGPIAHRDFNSPVFRTACICIPLIAYLYHFEKQYIGCLDDEKMLILGIHTDEKIERGFPVILVFHSVTTVALYFMHYQGKQVDKSIFDIQKLKVALSEARKVSKNAKKEIQKDK